MKGSKSKPKADTAGQAVNGITEGITKTAINDSSRTKSKNLDVVKEYANSNKKNAANFVVIGRLSERTGCNIRANLIRPCRCWEKHSNGPFTLRSESCGPKNNR